MAKTYQFDFVGYSPEFITLAPIKADNLDHAENKAMEQVRELYPELQDVEITESRVID